MASREELRALVIGLLRDAAQPRQFSLLTEIHRALSRRFGGVPPDDDLAVLEILHELMLAGVIVFGNNLEQPGYQWIRVTEFGRQCLEENDLLPYDPDGFLRRTRANLPGLDQIALTYLSEAVSAYNHNLPFASSVMLGVASERLMLLLIDAFGSSLETGDARERFEKATRGKRTQEQYQQFKKRLDPNPDTIPEQLTRDLDVYLDGIFSFVRIIRNAAGHPTGTDIRRNILSANIQAFPHYAERLIALTGYFADR